MWLERTTFTVCWSEILVCLSCYVSQLCIAVIKIPDKNNLKEVKFILSHSLSGSVHGGPTLLLWASGEAEHYGLTV